MHLDLVFFQQARSQNLLGVCFLEAAVRTGESDVEHVHERHLHSKVVVDVELSWRLRHG